MQTTHESLVHSLAPPTSRRKNLFRSKIFTENLLFGATCAYHNLDSKQNLNMNKAFAITSLNEKMHRKR
jgi:hypothetical protein